MISPKNYKLNVPANTQVRIAFSENVRPNSGAIQFRNEKQNVVVNVQSAEVRCEKDVCSIKPATDFEPGVYDMTFNEFAFVDYSGNTLQAGVESHVFSVSDAQCGLSYVNVDANAECYCQSVENQCQCQCGETYFVKDY